MVVSYPSRRVLYIARFGRQRLYFGVLVFWLGFGLRMGSLANIPTLTFNDYLILNRKFVR